MGYTEDIKKRIEEKLNDIEKDAKDSLIKEGEGRARIFEDIKRNLYEVYQMLPNNFDQSLEELSNLNGQVEQKAYARDQETLDAITIEVANWMEEIKETDTDKIGSDAYVTLRNRLLNIIYEKETSTNSINRNTRENGYFKEYSEFVEEKVQVLKNALERLENFIDENTYMLTSQKLTDIEMRAKDLVILEEKNQKDLAETVFVSLQELENETAILPKETDKTIDEEEKLQSPQEVATVYEELRQRIQELGGLQNVGHHARVIRGIEKDIARLEEFLANFSNSDIDLSMLKQTLDTIKNELTNDRNPDEPQKNTSIEQNSEGITRNYRRNRRSESRENTEAEDPFNWDK